MKLLFLEWNSYCNLDMIDAFSELGYSVEICPFPKGINTTQKEANQILQERLKEKGYDFVFSFNFLPMVSVCCQEQQIPYVSWVYDSPYTHVYSYIILNSCNYVFLFDYTVYEELKNAGISTVYYLPLAVNAKRLARLEKADWRKEKYSADVSFVGSLYDEPKHQLYDKLQGATPYVKGYLDAIIQAQKRVYGYNFLKEMLSADIIKEMQKTYLIETNETNVIAPEALYADYVLSRQVTALERKEIMNLLGERFDNTGIHLYTVNPKVQIRGVENRGAVDYYTEMPYVFLHSKINLNITLKSIKTGIPLRAFDIMGCGGFLLTNYQQELMQYFEPDVDFVYYTDYKDLTDKVEYYLSHEKERAEIAENGARKVLTEHTMVKRVESMMNVVFGDKIG